MTQRTPIFKNALGALSLISALGCSQEAASVNSSEGEDVLSVDPPDKLGSFAIGHTSFTAIDAGRADRSLLVDVWYPVDAVDAKDGPLTEYPLMAFIGLKSDFAVDNLTVSQRAGQSLLVFSHGYGGIHVQSPLLMETLASHGFVVASSEHTGNAQSSFTDEFDVAAANRVPDVSFVIDTMLSRNSDSDDMFYNRLNSEQVGVLGHSFGGMTAIGMATGWAGANPDPRVVAIAPISAPIDAKLRPDHRASPYAGFSDAQLADVTIPVMLIGGSRDVSVVPENNNIAYKKMVHAPWVYKVEIIGANHTHFSNVCDIGNLLIELGMTADKWAAIGAADLIEPYNATCTEDVFSIDEAQRLQALYVVSFFQRHLRGNTDYDYYLSDEYAPTEPSISLEARAGHDGI